MNARLPTLLLSCMAALAVCAVHAEDARKPKKAPGYAASVPEPTLVNIRYGDHERHILDFWKAPSDTPTPLVVVIHGGGWKGGSKLRLDRFADATALLKEGISVVAINYRLMRHAEGVEPRSKLLCMMPPVLFNLCAAKPRSGMLTKRVSVLLVDPPVPAPVYG